MDGGGGGGGGGGLFVVVVVIVGGAWGEDWGLRWWGFGSGSSKNIRIRCHLKRQDVGKLQNISLFQINL